MRCVALLVVVLCVATAASAQAPQPADGRFMAEWEPRRESAARYYPEHAIVRRVPGAAELCCTPWPDRRLACRVAYEWPRGLGFREAAMRIVETYRMTPASYAAFQSDPGAWLQIPIRFRVEGMAPEHAEAVDRVTEQTLGLCRHPGAPIS